MAAILCQQDLDLNSSNSLLKHLNPSNFTSADLLSQKPGAQSLPALLIGGTFEKAKTDKKAKLQATFFE